MSSVKLYCVRRSMGCIMSDISGSSQNHVSTSVKIILHAGEQILVSLPEIEEVDKIGTLMV